MRSITPFLVLAALARAGAAGAAFAPGSEAIVYNYRAEAERKDTISTHPVPVSLTAFVEFERAANAKNPRGYDALEKRGDLYWVVSGTRCRVVGSRPGGVLEDVQVRGACEIQVLNGDHKGKGGWILASLLRKRPRIVIDPPEPITDENRDSPGLLAVTLQAQDKVIYRELAAAEARATAAARTLPKGNPKRRARYDRAFGRALRDILDRYDLDEATAYRILDWGKAGDWPTEEPRDAPKAAP